MRRDRSLRTGSGFRKSAAGALVVLGAFLAGFVPARPGVAAFLAFSPAGTPLDADPILDLDPAVGQVLTFQISLNTGNLTAALNQIRYNFSYDTTELSLIAPAANKTNYNVGNQFGVLAVTTTVPPLNEPAATLIDLSRGNIAPNKLVQIGDIQFTVLPGLVNDGVFDFRLSVDSAFDVNNQNITAQFPQAFAFQEVEVQPQAGTVPEPPAFALLGLGLSLAAASAALRGTRAKDRRPAGRDLQEAADP